LPPCAAALPEKTGSVTRQNTKSATRRELMTICLLAVRGTW
jgi:hypothetical protein